MSEWVGHGYTVEIQQDMIDVTTGLPTLDPEPPMYPRSVPGLRHMTVRFVNGTIWSIRDASAVQQRIRDGVPLSHDFLDDVGVRTYSVFSAAETSNAPLPPG